jgi:hypothetical protein
MREINFRRDKDYGGNMQFHVHFEHDGRMVGHSEHLIPSEIRLSHTQLYEADPILSQTTSGFKSILKSAYNRRTQHYYIRHNGETKFLSPDDLFLVFTFKICSQEVEVLVSKKGSSYSINGINMARSKISSILSRILLDLSSKEQREEDIGRREIRKIINSAILTPEDIRYVLVSRLPYTFLKEGRTVSVRLKVVQISEEDYAIEISSNLWGKISKNNLLTMIGFYRHGKKNGNWKFLSPSKLFYRLIGKEPSSSELNLMYAFLEQNRSEKLVQERAMTLLDDLLKQYPERVFRNDTQELIRIIVLGRASDWLLVGRKSHMQKYSGVQAVSTRTLVHLAIGSEPSAKWGSSICINSGGANPSLGDQFASRILSLLNDSMTVGRVSTLGTYMLAKKPRIKNDKMTEKLFSPAYENNGDDDDMFRMPIEEV